MDIGLLFWILMILWGLSCIGAYAAWNGPWQIGSTFLQWFLFFLIGWKVFGFILHS